MRVVLGQHINKTHTTQYFLNIHICMYLYIYILYTDHFCPFIDTKYKKYMSHSGFSLTTTIRVGGTWSVARLSRKLTDRSISIQRILNYVKLYQFNKHQQKKKNKPIVSSFAVKCNIFCFPFTLDPNRFTQRLTQWHSTTRLRQCKESYNHASDTVHIR